MAKLILVMGLPGSGKTTLSKKLVDKLDAVWLNADQIRKKYNDWDFSEEGRIRQSKRMKDLSNNFLSQGKIVVADFICPTPKTRKKFSDVIKQSNTILWNGPMGVFEMSSFQNGTKAVANAVALATKKGSFSLVGGGDSVAAVKKFNLKDKISFISTGGGAMLESLEGKVLPGIKALQ